MPLRILIVEAAPIVAIDLVETVVETLPHASVDVCASLADAVAKWDARGPVDIVIASQPKHDIIDSRLSSRIGPTGGKIVLITSDVKDVPDDWIAIRHPFTTQRVAEVLLKLCDDLPLHPPEGHIRMPAS